jgi:lipopolysaccharide transport system ATP-binding protein
MPVIKVENISKMYDLGLVGTGTLSKDLNRTWAKLRGKPDPYATLAELNDRTLATKTGSVWALKDINFEVEQGEVLGIIGKNGAGKSTLLKILSQITTPTTGEIKIKGRVASLLEVGTGMHPEMTARQNIYLNGAIMGMSRREVTRKLDEIIDFAGIGKYVDTPIKRFSSGMQVRLGFAVAAFLEPEILIVDEVLAVGDAEFQKKAIGKMQDVSKGEGRTVLFVSHNMASVQTLCTQGLLIGNGGILKHGSINSVINHYLSCDFKENQLNIDNRKGNGYFIVEDIEFYSERNNLSVQTGKPLNIRIKIKKDKTISIKDFQIDLRIDDSMGNRIYWLSSSLLDNCKNTLGDVIIFRIPKLNLNQGLYYITTYLEINGDIADWVHNISHFEVVAGDFYGSGREVPINQSKLCADFSIIYNNSL